MAWKELPIWKKGMIIGIIFGVVLWLLDQLIYGTKVMGIMLHFAPKYFWLLLRIISIPGQFTSDFLNPLFEQDYMIMKIWFGWMVGLAIFYGLIGTIIGIVVGYYNTKKRRIRH